MTGKTVMGQPIPKQSLQQQLPSVQAHRCTPIVQRCTPVTVVSQTEWAAPCPTACKSGVETVTVAMIVSLTVQMWTGSPSPTLTDSASA